MCYVCKLCQTVVPPRTPMRKIVVYKRKGPFDVGKAIAGEIPVCEGCDPNKKPTIVEQPKAVPSPNGKHKVERRGPLCDVCSQPIGENGVSTVEHTLCGKHLGKSKGRRKSKG